MSIYFRTFLIFLLFLFRNIGLKSLFYKQYFFSECNWSELRSEKEYYLYNSDFNNLPGQNASNFWLAFWEKRRPHKFILHLTDLQLLLPSFFSFFHVRVSRSQEIGVTKELIFMGHCKTNVQCVFIQQERHRESTLSFQSQWVGPPTPIPGPPSPL